MINLPYSNKSQTRKLAFRFASAIMYNAEVYENKITYKHCIICRGISSNISLIVFTNHCDSKCITSMMQYKSSVEVSKTI